MATQKVFIDDGSTHIKLIWRDSAGELQLKVIPNTFTTGHTPAHSGNEANYLCDGNKYTFSQGSSKTLPTTDTSFQYGQLNAVAVHHALHESGIAPGEVDIVVTLPLSEFYDEENNRNIHNIQRKADTYKQVVTRNKKESFVIGEVSVLPESIPAGIEVSDSLTEGQSLLIVDIGGTTTNLAHIGPQISAIYKQKCLADTGVSSVIASVKSYLARCDEEMADITVHAILKRRNDREYLESVFNDEANINGLNDVIESASGSLADTIFQTIRHFGKYTHIMLCGGGGALTSKYLIDLTKIRKDRVTVSDNPQTDLVKGIEKLG